MKVLEYNVGTDLPTILCKTFEYKIGSLTLDQVPYMNPSTKYINVKYHHFCSYVANSIISILPIDPARQPADMLTRPLKKYAFIRHRKFIMGW